MNNTTILWSLTALICFVYAAISMRARSRANVSFSQYAIGKGSFPFVLIFFTYFATIMGAGNFFGHAGSAYDNGLPWLAYIFGEQGAKLVFALIFAGMAGAFSYSTLPEMLNDLVVKDKITRALSALMITIILVAMIGGQSKALGQIFAQFTGADPKPIMIVFSFVFILFTCFGGIYSVIWNDLIQGILCCVFAIIFYAYAFSKVDFSFIVLGEKLTEIGRAELWSFQSVSAFNLFNKFFTGLIGILVSQVIWQRCFSSKSSKEARHSLFFSGIVCIVFTMLTAFVGLIIVTLNQNLDANTAMSWFMANAMPKALAVMIFLLVLCAGMSTANSALNSCAVVIVNDLVKPFVTNISDQHLILWAKVFTILVGTASCIAGIFSSSIYSLISGSNTLAASALAPLVIIGLFWKKSASKHQMGSCNSKITPWAARLSIISGFVCALFPVFHDAPTIWAVFVGSIVLVIVSLLSNTDRKTDSL